MSLALWTLIDAYLRAKTAWEATVGHGGEECDNPEYEALRKAELAFLQHRCGSLEELNHKVGFIIGDDSMLSCYRGDRTEDNEDYSVVFLRALTVYGEPS